MGYWNESHFSAATLVVVIVLCRGCLCQEGEPLIVGGSGASIEDFPYHVGIYKSRGAPGVYKNICGGTLISTSVVISAAHCFWRKGSGNGNSGEPENKSVFRVAAGKTYRAWKFEEDKKSVQRRKVDKVTFSKRYIGLSQSLSYDIAVITLNRPVTLTSSVGLAEIDWDDELTSEQLAPGSFGTVVGWGVSEKGSASEVLKFASLPYIDEDTCFESLSKMLRQLLSHDQFCAGYLNSNTSVCPGDSGGGLVFHHEPTGRNFLRGIVSLAFRPANYSDKCYSQHYTAFTKVSPDVLRKLGTNAEQLDTRSRECGRRFTTPNVDGQHDANVEFRWHSAVYEKTGPRQGDFSYVCGGSLIAAKFVVTAAHCFYDYGSSKKKDSSLYRISAGATKSTYEESTNQPTPEVQTFKVATISLHPEFTGSNGNFANNLAVVRLDRPALFTHTVAPVCVDWNGAFSRDLRDGAKGFVSGLSAASEENSTTLKWIYLPYINLETCANYVRNSSSERFVFAPNFCVGSVNKSTVSCRSDAGGGFSVLQPANRRYYLRGVVVVELGHSSYRVQCYSQGYTLLQAIEPHTEWIQEVMSASG